MVGIVVEDRYCDQHETRVEQSCHHLIACRARPSRSPQQARTSASAFRTPAIFDCNPESCDRRHNISAAHPKVENTWLFSWCWTIARRISNLGSDPHITVPTSSLTPWRTLAVCAWASRVSQLIPDSVIRHEDLSGNRSATTSICQHSSARGAASCALMNHSIYTNEMGCPQVLFVPVATVYVYIRPARESGLIASLLAWGRSVRVGRRHGEGCPQ
jgi:hypothetical protein